MPDVSFHEQARVDFDEATAFYAVERTSLGDAFIDAIESAIAQVAEHPQVAPIIRGRVRRMRAARFPYSVMYSVVDDKIRVLAIAHDRRRPYYWADRS